MATKKMTAEEAKRLFQEEFERSQRIAREIHEDVMKGLVIPIIEQGLLDDVEPPEEP
jgi:hypothetical protein